MQTKNLYAGIVSLVLAVLLVVAWDAYRTTAKQPTARVGDYYEPRRAGGDLYYPNDKGSGDFDVIDTYYPREKRDKPPAAAR